MASAPAVFDLPRVDLDRSLADADLVRNILFVPPSMPVTALLASMQGTRMQMALVIDEYGGTDGLVSLEDIVEMVVGDIEDEHDDEARPMIVPDGDGIFLADARADLDEVAAAIGADLAPGEESEDVDTIGGLVFSLLGRIPVRGELVAAPGGFEFEILDADPRRIKRLQDLPAAAPARRDRSRAAARASVHRNPTPATDAAPAVSLDGVARRRILVMRDGPNRQSDHRALGLAARGGRHWRRRAVGRWRWRRSTCFPSSG